MPMNQPLMAIRLRVAGAAHTRIKKYLRAKMATSSEQGTIASAAVTKSHCTNHISAAPIKAMPTLCPKRRAHCSRSSRPYACAVIPLVPTRKKPKFQYSKSNSIVPIAIPPIACASEICPTIAVSTNPTNGMVIFAKILGIAKRRICRFIIPLL